jgi:hypothetical protein
MGFALFFNSSRDLQILNNFINKTTHKIFFLRLADFDRTIFVITKRLVSPNLFFLFCQIAVKLVVFSEKKYFMPYIDHLLCSNGVLRIVGQ